MFFPSRLALFATLFCVAPVAGQDILDYESPPIEYSKGVPDNLIVRLQNRLSDGRTKLPFDPTFGYLPAVLKELSVPVSSQVLSFAKTSLQAGHISPTTPRAIYFNDEVHVGFVHGSDTLLELAVADRKLGTTFYTLSQTDSSKPTFVRQTNRCLNCHGDTRARGVPGLLVRSVFPDPEGRPVIAAGSFRTDHTSPLGQRWGGWYVTGTHGRQAHLGNFTLPNAKKPKAVDNARGQNVTDLAGRLEQTYLSGHSDLVALMVLEHQIDAVNYMTRLRFEAQAARPEDKAKRVLAAAEQLVSHLLFVKEAKLSENVKGTAAFAADFEKRGPFDNKGRSLRQLDLTTRLFKYPCSYAIYSETFDSLPQDVKAIVYRRLWEVLAGDNPVPAFSHLTTADRQAVRDILRDTKPGIPAYWR